jgi:3-dehydroquinate synthase
MDAIERTLQVSWQHRVLFTDHVFDPANAALKDILAGDGLSGPGRTLVVLDDSLAKVQPRLAAEISSYFAAHSEQLSLVRKPMLQRGGEPAKNSWLGVFRIHKAINRHHLDRHSCLVAVGGGALLDVAGLAAATAHRGVRHVRIPTTTLSQCDAGVGVKNGINAFGKKNFIGTFAPPLAVINDFQLLSTLPPRDKRAGYAEAIKVACIRDGSFFEALERDAVLLRQFDSEAMRRLIRRCAELHLNHIADSGDPFEWGSARPLDFGHWAAHKLEQLSRFRLCHGEAVAIGIALDVIYSRLAGCLKMAEAERILGLLQALGFALFARELSLAGPGQEWCLIDGLEEFREHLGGKLAITLLRGVGSAFEVHEIIPSRVREAVNELQTRYGLFQLPRRAPYS